LGASATGQNGHGSGGAWRRCTRWNRRAIHPGLQAQLAVVQAGARHADKLASFHPHCALPCAPVTAAIPRLTRTPLNDTTFEPIGQVWGVGKSLVKEIYYGELKRRQFIAMVQAGPEDLRPELQEIFALSAGMKGKSKLIRTGKIILIERSEDSDNG